MSEETAKLLTVAVPSYQGKSRACMMELMGGGTTVLFASHSLDQIREICKRVVWREHGRVKMIGKADEVCDVYAGE